MKYAISILLVTLLFFNSSLYTIIYSIKVIELSFIASVKVRLMDVNDEKENYNTSNVSLIKISLYDTHNRNIKWINENEFLLEEKYCDIICKRVYNDSLYICYIHDNEEDELNNIVQVHYQNEEGKSSEMQYFNILFSFLSNAICVSYTAILPPDGKTILSPDRVLNLISINSDIPSPPPRHLF